jgi:hypothetical protein
MNVAELIAVLRELPQDLPVEMSMNMEYQCPVSADMVVVEDYRGERYVCINDCPGA